MNQQSLFDNPAPNKDKIKKLTRRSNADTSRQAAEKLVASGKMHAHAIIALAIVRRFPESTGGEIDELAQRLYELTGRQASKRLAGIEGIQSGEPRICRIGGNRAKVWWF